MQTQSKPKRWVLAAALGAMGIWAMVAMPVAHAAGFLLLNHGARATGRANAFAATADDPTALWHNPAGITQLPGYQLYLGASLIRPTVTFTPADGSAEVQTEPNLSVTPAAYFTAQASKSVTVGIGMNTPYGSRIAWPASSPGRDILRELQLRTYFITPTVALNLDPYGVHGLSLAAGFDVVPAGAYLRRDLVFGGAEGQVELSGSDVGLGGRFGLLYKPHFVKGLRFGVMYRLPVAFNFEGTGDFDSADPTQRGALPADGDGSVALTIPMAATFALAYDLEMIPLTVEVNVMYVGWSSYDALQITLPDQSVSSSRRDWEDRVSVRTGLEYDGGAWAVRGGYTWDPTPVPNTTLDFTLPDINRHAVTLGAGYSFAHNITLDAGFWYLIPGTNTTSDEPLKPREKGDFEVKAWTATVGLSFAFGGAGDAAAEQALLLEDGSSAPKASAPQARLPQWLRPQG